MPIKYSMPQLISVTGLSNRIIACLDVKANFVVKGTQFRNLTNVGDPIALANSYSFSGADELCLLNVNLSAANERITFNTIEQISQNCFIPLTVGGGVRRLKDVELLLRAGADKVAINSASVHNPGLIAKCVNKFGSQCIVASVDCKASNGSWEVFTYGGLRSTGIDAIKHICMMEQLGVGEILLTSMDKDGTKTGFDILLLKLATTLVSIPVIASGGFGFPHHAAMALIDGGASAVLIASQLHQNQCSISQIKFLLGRCGVLVRDDYVRLGLYDE
ncbi:MAG: imidazole glycerol phosphate synthase subunit HisF [Candidatus Hodgkinia cicadicola]